MSLLGVIAFSTGTLGVLLTIRQNIYCWPMALVSVVAAGIEFYSARLFGDMSLQVFYFFAGVYGWIYWSTNLNLEFKVTKMELSRIPVLVGVTGLQFGIYYYLLVYFGGARPVIDAILTAASLTTTYMMTKKWVENWLLWVFIDTAYIVLYGLTDLWLYGLLYFLFAVMAFYGWLKWRRTL
jgi:nicotinamide mononucleotide transporter